MPIGILLYVGGLYVFKPFVITFLILSCFSLVLPTQAESLQSLTLDQALEIGVKNNPGLKATQARLGISDAEIITAGTRLNPSFVTDNGIAEKTYRIGIEKTFELGKKRQKRVAMVEAQRQELLAEINTKVLDIRSEVRRAYTQLYNLQERQRRFQKLLQLTESLLEIAQKREAAGDIPQLDVLQAELAVLNTKNDLQTLVNQTIQARNTLNLLLNKPIGVSIQLAPPSTFPEGISGRIALDTAEKPFSSLGNITQLDMDADRLVQHSLSNRPELQQNLLQIETVKRQLDLAHANRIPNLTLAGGPDLVFEEEGNYNLFIVGNLELPLFNKQKGPIQEALARKTYLEQEQEALKNRISIEIANAYSAFVLNKERINQFETEILPKSLEILQKSKLGFEVGKVPILVPINAQQSYINTQITYLQALLEYQNAISDLERAVGSIQP